MTANGIRGTRNERDTKNPVKFKYYAIRLETAAREVYEIKNNLSFVYTPDAADE